MVRGLIVGFVLGVIAALGPVTTTSPRAGDQCQSLIPWWNSDLRERRRCR